MSEIEGNRQIPRGVAPPADDTVGAVGTVSDEDLVPIPQSDSDPLIGRVLDGRYRLDRLIAVGGMGRVYQGHQESLNRKVAVKILAMPAGASIKDPDFEERFALEASASSRIGHANTVTVYDFGRTLDGVFYIAMEFIDGVSLARVLRVERRLHPARALYLTRQMCRALRVAHSRGVIHRDLKPSNVLLVHSAEEGEVARVLDFGLAKLVASQHEEGSQLTRVGTFIGTPEYAAPEVSRFGVSDQRSDIYSVGVMLYRMVSGRVPFRGPTDAATIVSAVNDPVPPFEASLGVPSRVESLIFKCLEREPSRRFQSMDELLPALGTCLVELGVETASLMAPSVVSPSVVTQLVDLLPPQTDPEVELESDEAPARKVGPGLVAVVVFVLGVGAALVGQRLASTAAPALPVQAVQPGPALFEPAQPAAVEPAAVEAGQAEVVLEATAAPAVEAPRPTPIPPVAQPEPPVVEASLPSAGATSQGASGGAKGVIPPVAKPAARPPAVKAPSAGASEAAAALPRPPAAPAQEKEASPEQAASLDAAGSGPPTALEGGAAAPAGLESAAPPAPELDEAAARAAEAAAAEAAVEAAMEAARRAAQQAPEAPPAEQDPANPYKPNPF